LIVQLPGVCVVVTVPAAMKLMPQLPEVHVRD
jgi:hypothetical protein